MKWKMTDKMPPKGGDIRTVRRFAWKPTQIGRYTVWLERFEIELRYFQPESGNAGWWSEVERRTLVWMY